MHQPTDRISHTTAFVTPIVEHWLERDIAQQIMRGMFPLLPIYGLLYSVEILGSNRFATAD